MQKVLVMGAGKIGSLIATLLANSNDYQVYLSDVDLHSLHHKKRLAHLPHFDLIQLDASNQKEVADFIKKNQIGSIISALPYFCNPLIMQIAKELSVNYFDLTEDTKNRQTAKELSQQIKSVFVPQCGLAPGFISIAANSLMKEFTELEEVKMRVGALPLNISNALQYSLTWSTDGLINEYGNLCESIENSKQITLLPLDGLEEIKIDGLTYEAFNTSGGIGSLAESYVGKIKKLTYKTIRYPGHCSKMRFLMSDLKLNEDRATLKRILENALPKTTQDVVLVYVSVTGLQENNYAENSYVKKFYPKKLNGFKWSAIQLTTASGICAVFDLVMTNPGKYQGLVRQENFSLDAIIQNRFGEYYA